MLSFFWSLIKTIYLRIWIKPLSNNAKSPLPVDVRRSETPLLKLPHEQTMTLHVLHNFLVNSFCFPRELTKFLSLLDNGNAKAIIFTIFSWPRSSYMVSSPQLQPNFPSFRSIGNYAIWNDREKVWKNERVSYLEAFSLTSPLSDRKVRNCWFSHDVTKIQTTELSILPWFYFHDVLEQLKTNFHTNFCFKRVLGFVIEYAWISKLLRDAAFTWRPRELSCRLKKWLISGNFAI